MKFFQNVSYGAWSRVEIARKKLSKQKTVADIVFQGTDCQNVMDIMHHFGIVLQSKWVHIQTYKLHDLKTIRSEETCCFF